MKFSEAIRLGAMSTKQVFGLSYRKDLITEEITHTCALGAALHAVGGLGAAWPTEWNWAYEILAHCPVRHCAHRTPLETPCVLTVTAHLNDSHHWSREKVADWVAQMEPKYLTSEPTPVEQVAV